MKCNQPLPLYFGILFFLWSSLLSCGLFGIQEDIPVIPCNAATATGIQYMVPGGYGTITRIEAEINGIPDQKWVILPDSPKDKVYVPCNFPYQLKKVGQRIYFEAYVLQDTLPLQDTLINGFIPIELIQVQKK
jgi:hypothetical protein